MTGFPKGAGLASPARRYDASLDRSGGRLHDGATVATRRHCASISQRHSLAAVDHQAVASDEGSVLAREEHGRPPDISLAVTDPTECRPRFGLASEVGIACRPCLELLGTGERADGVDP